MIRSTEQQEHPTGEVCPGCETDVVIAFGVGAELWLRCDCGDALALDPSPSRLAHAA